jgi:histidine ammonia-lyase
MAALAKGGEAVEFDADAWERMLAARRVVERAVESGETVYGVNTGFGKLSDVRIGHDALAELQTNLVRSHACGVGEPLRPDETRLVLCLRANCFATGRSGIRPETAEALLRLYRADALPVVPSVGSVGASGDLAPLAHVALVLIGEGEAWVRGARTSGRDALAAAGIEPVALAPKEGLSLVNGTQVMLAVGALALHRAISVARAADVAAAMSTEALLGTDAAFDPRIHAARPHGGQAKVAAKLARLMSASGLRETHRTDDPRVQDAYSIRCAPQVHGACRDSLEHAARVVEVESGAATDNPLVFAEEGELISGGNFHGAPIALAFDQARTALAVLASICERRTDRLVNPDLNEGLPPFLSGRPGLESGLMMPHVLSAALVNELRTTSHPACVDNTPTSGGKEDHVSMGMTGALLLRRAVEAAALVVAVELAAAARGLAFREPTLPGPELQAASAAVRTHAPVQSGDAPLGPVVEALARAVLSGEFDAFGESP